MDIEMLKDVLLFENLNDVELEKISKIMTVKSFKKGTVLFMEGEEGNAMYIIKTGKIKILNVSNDGKEKIFSILNEGEFLGEMALIDTETRSATAEAMEDVEAYVIVKDEFLDMLVSNVNLALKLMQTLSSRIRTMNKEVEILIFKDVHAAFANVLKELSLRYGIVSGKKIIINIQLTHKELASLVGISRETMTRLINKVKKEGIIDIDDKKVVILNQEALEEMLTREI